jgi:hypothetical protein
MKNGQTLAGYGDLPLVEKVVVSQLAKITCPRCLSAVSGAPRDEMIAFGMLLMWGASDTAT